VLQAQSPYRIIEWRTLPRLFFWRFRLGQALGECIVDQDVCETNGLLDGNSADDAFKPAHVPLTLTLKLSLCGQCRLSNDPGLFNLI